MTLPSPNPAVRGCARLSKRIHVVPPTILLRVKPKILAVHRWLALLAGLFVILQGLTGTLIAFRYELNRVVYPGIMTVAADGASAPVGAIIRAAERALPGAHVTRLDYPRAADDAYIARLVYPYTDNAAIATLDHQGHVMRARGIWAWPVEAAFQLHANLLSGDAGLRAVGFVGLAVVLLALSGLLYWWPNRGRFAVTLGQTLRPKPVNRDLHRFIGVVYALYLLMMATLGLTLAWEPWVQPVIGQFLSFAPDAKPKVPKKRCAAPAPIEASIAAAQGLRPGQAIKSVRFPNKGRIVAVYFQSNITTPTRVTDHVWLDACSADVLAADDPAQNRSGDTFFNWLLPIHSGDWLGLPGRLLSWSAAVALVLMGVTGYVLWLLRVLKRRRGRAQRAGRT
jgi:uncharacterized iron-regulated membrane protein